MSVFRSVSKSVFPSVHRASKVPAALLGSGETPFNPASISGLRSRLLDATTFTSPIGSKYYLADSSTTNTHLPRQGRAWLFDGANDFGTALNPSSLTGDYTVSFWAKLNDWTTLTNTGVVSSWNGASGWMIYANGGKLRAYRAANYYESGAVSASYNNTWTHVVIVASSATATIYFNASSSFSGSIGVSTQLPNTTVPFQIGAYNNGNGIQINGSLCDIRVYDVAKTAGEVTAIYNQSRTGSGTFDTTGLVAAYPCNEESGTTGYDISGNGNHLTLTNITQATFHAADTGVTANPNNTEGYRLSGSVYIPKRLTDSLAADGNALTVTGRAAYHGCVETPCITGNGSNVYVDLGTSFTATGDFEIEVLANLSASPANMGLIGHSTNAALFINDTVSTRVYIAGVAKTFVTPTLVSGTTYLFRVTRVSNSLRLFINGVESSTGAISASGDFTFNQFMRSTTANYANGWIANVVFTTSGIATYFPLQDGPGSSNTNRDIAWVKSDGTGGVISGAIVNGTVSTIWGNRVPGNVEDWCVKYGGRIAANGAFVAGMLTGDNAADGSAKTLAAGKFGNPFSRLNLNPATAAELNGRSIPTAAVAGADINSTITPTDSAFRRTASDGDDRILLYDDTLSGADLTNVEGYVA